MKVKSLLHRTILSTSLMAVLGASATTSASDTLMLIPSEGYNFSQSQALTQRFALDMWNIGTDIDFSRYAYTHASQFFPHASIPRAGEVAELKSKPSKTIGSIKQETEFGELTLDQWAEGHLDGVIVIHKGKIVYEKYPRMQASDKHIWWSVSKSMVGTLVGVLEAQGKVNIDQPIEQYIPELKESDWSGTPVRHILEMASGMSGLEADDPEAYSNPDSDYLQFEASFGIGPRGQKFTASVYDYVASLKRLKPSGEKHEYTSVNTFVLSWLLEEITDKPYAEIVSDLYWQHIGAEAEAQVMVSPTGAPASHGMISSTLRDLGRYGMLFTPSWNKVSEKQIIPDSLIAKIQNDGRPELFKTGLFATMTAGYSHGDGVHTAYQWDYVTNDGDMAKTGFHGQTLYVSPANDLVVASFATAKHYDTLTFARAFAKQLKK